jgi:hypothetical protein
VNQNAEEIKDTVKKAGELIKQKVDEVTKEDSKQESK